MRYVSTRGGVSPVGFTDCLLEGLAADGGLYVPEALPHDAFDTIAGGQSYQHVAFAVCRIFIDDIDDEVLRGAIAAAYDEQTFDHAGIVSLDWLEPGLGLLGLSHGPTYAFKDMALQLLGQLFEHELERRETSLMVVGATSGDTGSSAEYAMIGASRVSVVMLSPHGRMSPFQMAQMYSLDEPNIHNVAVRGVFDECQDLVKEVNADAAFKATYRIGAVNSINWARVMAQVVYYVWVGLQIDEPFDVVVPSGNFGNVFAGHVAKQIGTPIRHLIVATNENTVLHEAIAEQRYRVRAAESVHATSSPSMDIAKASNFERYVHWLTGGDGAAVGGMFSDLSSHTVDLSPWSGRIAESGFRSGTSTHQDRLSTIRTVYEKYGVLIDPHTADGVKVGLDFRDPNVPMVCLETARPAKFAATIEEAVGFAAPLSVEAQDLLDRPHHVSVIDADIDVLKAAIVTASGS